MLDLSAFTLIFNGVSLVFSLGVLLILLWYDSQNRLIQAFASFLFMVGLWNAGSLALQFGVFIKLSENTVNTLIAVMGFGFSGASIALYILVTLLVGVHTRFFRLVAISSLLLYVIYRLVLVTVGAQVDFDAGRSSQLDVFPIAFYLLFDIAGVYLLWAYRRRIDSNLMLSGMSLFVLGQGLVFLDPALTIVSLATTISTIGALFIGFAFLQQEIIMPLAERSSQVSTMHRVSLAISSQLSIDTVLNEIAVQAAGWVGADAVGIFLRDGDTLDLVNVYELPVSMKHTRVPIGSGVVGSVAQRKTSIYLENYSRDWQDDNEDLPHARETFGSIICVPLMYVSRVIGVLMVVAGKQGRSFKGEDVFLLELLGAQAAVAIAHSQLFQDVESARSQLETLLTSTENPVLAIDDSFNLIFANPAARRITAIENAILHQKLDELLLPRSTTQFIANDPQNYELVLDDRVYLCHLAPLGERQIAGWVTVMNDITELIELDRMKSEMLRMVSHDLKNPLMGAMLYLDLAKDEALTSSQSESLEIIETQLERMNRIIRGVLDLERIRSGLGSQAVCDARAIAESALRDLRRTAEDKQIRLQLDIDTDEELLFKGDSDQFERALSNLIDNAIKFTLESGQITISVRRESDDLIFSIKDTGIGIPEDLQSHVFERFFRGRQRGVEHVTGTGLGLSIVKTVVENHKGRIWLSSAEGEGTSFFIAVNAFDDTTKISHSH